MAQGFRLIGRHTKWVSGASISEFVNDENTRRYTATIRGWRGWFIWEGGLPFPVEQIAEKVRSIRDRIDAGDESVFHQEQKLVTTGGQS